MLAVVDTRLSLVEVLVTVHDQDRAKRAERARAVGLFRYALVRAAADPQLSPRERGVPVRELAAAEHAGPFGQPVRVSRATLDRWIRAWRAGGFDALVPDERRVVPRTEAQVLDLAAALKREKPQRTAAQVRRVVVAHLGWAPSERTLQRLFERLELRTRPDGRPPQAFSRFAAAHPNDLWVTDALHGPKIAGRNTYLFAVLDDHSRLLTGYRWGHREDTLRLEAALRTALSKHGVPSALYCDNGSPYASAQLAYACARLGIRIVHSRPGKPQGRGKIERAFGTVRGQFLAEVAPAGGAGSTVSDIDDLNSKFAAWVETVYHRQVHSETGQPPADRYDAGWAEADGPRRVSPEQLRQAFLWVATRQVSKTATVSLLGNAYVVDAALVGRKVELAYDPADLSHLEVSWRGTPMGTATPLRIGRHVHPAAKPETTPPPRPETGIDYLSLLEADHTAQHAVGINYLAIANPNHPGASNAKAADTDAGGREDQR
jgi:putative transposase